MKTFVQIRTRVEGLHHWPSAPEPEGYLRSPHRHLFVVEVDIQVFHDDREIEINAVTRWLNGLLPSFGSRSCEPSQADEGRGALDFGSQSCEQLASRVVEAILARYGRHRSVRCVVLEDGTLGGGVTWDPDEADKERLRA